MNAQRPGPNEPGWTPPDADPDRPDYGKYGHGSDFGSDVFALYRAGRLKLPDMASRCSTMTTAAHDYQQRTSFLNDSVGGERALNMVEELRAELQDDLRRTTNALSASGKALVDLSVLFLETDQEAVRSFRSAMADVIKKGLEDFSHPTKPISSPPGSTSPYDNKYDAPSLAVPPSPLENWFHDKEREVGGKVADKVGDATDGGLNSLRKWWEEQSHE